LGGLTLIEHQIIELRHRLLVAFQLLMHSEPGHVSMLSCFTLLRTLGMASCS
jgi:hypothetical protein